MSEKTKIGYNILHWGPCVVHTKISSEAVELFLKEAKHLMKTQHPPWQAFLTKKLILEIKINLKNSLNNIFLFIIMLLAPGKNLKLLQNII